MSGGSVSQDYSARDNAALCSCHVTTVAATSAVVMPSSGRPSPHLPCPPAPALPCQRRRPPATQVQWAPPCVWGNPVAPGGRGSQPTRTRTESLRSGCATEDLTGAPHLGGARASASCCSLRAGEKSPFSPEVRHPVLRPRSLFRAGGPSPRGPICPGGGWLPSVWCGGRIPAPTLAAASRSALWCTRPGMAARLCKPLVPASPARRPHSKRGVRPGPLWAGLAGWGGAVRHLRAPTEGIFILLRVFTPVWTGFQEEKLDLSDRVSVCFPGHHPGLKGDTQSSPAHRYVITKPPVTPTCTPARTAPAPGPRAPPCSGDGPRHSRPGLSLALP